MFTDPLGNVPNGAGSNHINGPHLHQWHMSSAVLRWHSVPFAMYLATKRLLLLQKLHTRYEKYRPRHVVGSLRKCRRSSASRRFLFGQLSCPYPSSPVPSKLTSREVLLQIPEDTDVLGRNKVDSHTLPSEAARATDTVQVVFTGRGQVVVDDEGHLLDIDTARPDVGGDEDTALSRAELGHDRVTLLLHHLAVHAADGEVGLAHLLGKPVDLATGVAEDDRLCDSKAEGRVSVMSSQEARLRVVEVTQGVKLPVLLLDGDEELLDALKGKLVTLDKDANGVGHELGGHLKHVVGESGRNNDDLSRGRKVTVNVVNLVLEALVQELVRLVENEHLDVLGAEVAAADHVKDTTGGTADNLLASLKLANVLPDRGATNTRVTRDVHVVAKSENDGLNLDSQLACRRKNKSLGLADVHVERLEGRNGKRGRLTGTRLSLRNNIAATKDGNDGTLLDSRGLFKVCKLA